MLPWIRFLLFIFLIILLLANIYAFDIIGGGKFVTFSGFVTIDNHGLLYVVIDIILASYRTIALFLVLFKLIQYPHDVIGNKKGDELQLHQDQKEEDESYIWDSFYAFLLMIIGTTNSNDLLLELFSSKLFTSIHDISMDGNIQVVEGVTTTAIHNFVRWIFLIMKIVCTFWGLILFCINMSKPGTFNWKVPNIGSLILFSFEILVFFSGLVISVLFAILMRPANVKDVHAISIDGSTNEFLETRTLEFAFEVTNELILILCCHALVVFYYFTTDKRTDDIIKNGLVFTFPLRGILLGLYTSTLSSWQLLSFHYSGLLHSMTDFEISIPIIIYLSSVVFVSIAIMFISFERDGSLLAVRKEIYNFGKLLSLKVSHRNIQVILWKIGITFGFASLVIILMSVNGGWYDIKIKPGTVPSRVIDFIKDIEEDIEEKGHQVFDAIKDLDPCRWDPAKGTEDTNSKTKNNVQWTYSLNDTSGNPIPGTTYTSKLDLKKSSLTNYKNLDDPSQNTCKDKPNHDNKVTCHTLNQYTDTLRQNQAKQTQIASDPAFSGFYDNHNFTTFDDDNREYRNKLTECHNVACETVLLTAIGYEATMFFSNLAAWLPFGVGAEEEAAVEWTVWFGQMSNRVGHGVVKASRTMYWFVRKLKTTVGYLKTMFTSVRKLAAYTKDYVVTPKLDSYVIFIPSIIYGGLCFLLGFWKRENTKSVAKDVSNLINFFIPLLLANVIMVLLLFLFPFLITELLKTLPPELIKVYFRIRHPLRLIRIAFTMSSVGCIILISSIIIELYGKISQGFTKVIRGFRSLLKPIRTISNYTRGNVNTSVLVENGGCVEAWFDVDWLQSAIISAPVFVFVYFIFVQNLEWITFTYGPTGDFIKIVQGFDSHAHLLAHSHRTKEDFEAFTCGLVGKAIEEAISFAITTLADAISDLANRMEQFLESIALFQSIMTGIEDAGHIIADIFDDTWRLAEKLLVMFVPMINTMLFLLGSVVSARMKRFEKASEEYENLNYLLNTIFSIIGLLAIYNITLILMAQELFKTINQINMFVFYFRARVGLLSTYALISSGLNLLGLFSLYIGNMYPLL